MLHARLRAAAGNRGGIPTDGLVAWYTMDSISGSTLVDETGSYDGTITGATQVTGVVGQALNFDGSGDYVTAPSIAENATTTVCFWFKASSVGDLVVVEKFQAGYWSIQQESTGAVGIFDLANGRHLTSSVLGTGVWHHLIMEIKNNADSKIYTNNMLDSNDLNSIDRPSTGSSASLILGSRSGTGGYFDGLLDDVIIYNRALTPSERAAIYSRGA